MYKALLVDDENLVIKSLEAGVDWRKSGFYVAGKANNGAKALQLVKEIKPHVVFTDIRMPGLSGLELIKTIKETNDQVQIVVISGYAEFAYVQKSLNYGVLGYCLKPFDDYEIDALLRTAAKNIEDFRQKRENRMLELIEDSQGEQTAAAFDRLLADSGLNDGPLSVLVALGKGRLRFEEGIPVASLHVGSSKTAYFVPSGAGGSSVGSIRGLIREPLPEEVLGIGFLESERDLPSVRKAIESASELASNFFIHGRNRAYSPEKNETDAEETANRLLRALRQALANRQPALVRELLGELKKPNNKRRLGMAHALTAHNLVVFHAAEPRAGQDDDCVVNREQLLSLYPDFDGMIDSLISDALGQGKEPNPLPGKRTGHASLKEIVRYIDANYRGDITIQTISKRYYMNPNYLSQLFRRELGVTFTDYLTQARLKQARSLLVSSDLTIGEVAESAGFRDYFYFIRLFKKHTAETPRQYRLNAQATSRSPEYGRDEA